MSLFAEFPQTVTFIRKGINLCLRGTPNVSVNVCLSISFWVYILASVLADILSNTCNFHRKFRFILPLHLSENAQNVHFREAKFQNFPGEHAPGPPTVLAPSALDTIFVGLTLNCFRRACYYQWVILSIILRILPTQKDVSFLSRKRVHLPYYTEIYILRTADMRSAQA